MGSDDPGSALDDSFRYWFAGYTYLRLHYMQPAADTAGAAQSPYLGIDYLLESF